MVLDETSAGMSEGPEKPAVADIAAARKQHFTNVRNEPYFSYAEPAPLFNQVMNKVHTTFHSQRIPTNLE